MLISGDKVIKKLVLKLRLAEVISRMSLPDCNKEQPEAEYSNLING